MDPVKVNQANEEAEQSYNTSEPEQVNKARKKEARNRSVRLEFIKAAMGLPEGRAWFYDLLNFTNVFQTPYTGDPNSTAFKCGVLNVGLKILDDIQTVAPEQYILMIREGKNR